MDWVLFFLFMYFIAPVCVARLALRAPWSVVVLAYGVLLAFIFASAAVAAIAGTSVKLAFGWAVIVGMFGATPTAAVIAIGAKIQRRLS